MASSSFYKFAFCLIYIVKDPCHDTDSENSELCQFCFTKKYSLGQIFVMNFLTLVLIAAIHSYRQLIKFMWLNLRGRLPPTPSNYGATWKTMALAADAMVYNTEAEKKSLPEKNKFYDTII